MRLGRRRDGGAVPRRAATMAMKTRKRTRAGRAARRDVKAPGAVAEAAHVPPVAMPSGVFARRAAASASCEAASSARLAARICCFF